MTRLAGRGGTTGPREAPGVRVRALAAPLRSGPLDAADERGRSRERWRRAARAAAAAALGKAVALAGVLLSVPLTVRHLGRERYGLWMTISSLLAVLGSADLGLGVGLMNSVAHADGRGDREAAAGAVSGAFFLLLGVGAALLLAAAAAHAAVPWARLFGVTSARAAAEAGPAVTVLLACTAVGLPLGLVQRVQLGYQEGAASHLWNGLGGLFGLLGLLLAVRWGAGLPGLAAATAGAPLLALALNNLVYFGLQRPDLRPRRALVRRDRTKALFRLGAGFFLLNLCHLLSCSLDRPIIAATEGVEAVAAYAVCVQYFGLGLAAINLMSTTLWAAYGEAFARGDRAWLRRTFGRSLRGAVLAAGVLAAVQAAVGRPALRAWAGPACAPGPGLIGAVGAWGVLDAARIAASTFLNAINAVRFQLAVFALLALVGSAVKLAAARAFGPAGVAWAGFASSLLIMLVPLLVHAHRRLSGPDPE